MSITQHEDALVKALVSGNRSRANQILTAVNGNSFSMTSFIEMILSEGLISPVTRAYQEARDALNGKGMSEDKAILIVSDIKTYFGE
jgi:hypothetical protein